MVHACVDVHGCVCAHMVPTTAESLLPPPSRKTHQLAKDGRNWLPTFRCGGEARLLPALANCLAPGSWCLGVRGRRQGQKGRWGTNRFMHRILIRGLGWFSDKSCIRGTISDKNLCRHGVGQRVLERGDVRQRCHWQPGNPTWACVAHSLGAMRVFHAVNVS